MTAICTKGHCTERPADMPAIVCDEAHVRIDFLGPDDPGYWVLHCREDLGEKLQAPPLQGKAYNDVFLYMADGNVVSYYGCSLARTTLHC